MSRNLVLRFLTAGVVAPTVVSVLYFAPPWGWFLAVLTAVGLVSAELFAMTHRGDRLSQAYGLVSTLAVSSGLYFYPEPRSVITVVVALPLCGMIWTLFRLGDVETAGLRLMAIIAAPLYVGVMLGTMAFMRRDLGAAGPAFAVFTMALAWFGDALAMLAGKLWGNARLCPAISPKKTWAGLWGALVGALIAGAWAYLWLIPGLRLLDALLLSLVGGVLGQLGDLTESLVKRATQTKDSGWIMPGHGGLFDRVDSLIFVSAAVYLYVLWFRPISGG